MMDESKNIDATAPIFSTFADDPDYAELLTLFADNIPIKRQILQQSHLEGKIEELRTSAHQLKGTGGGYGFAGLTKVAAELEEACKQNDAEQVGRCLDRVLKYLDRIAV